MYAYHMIFNLLKLYADGDTVPGLISYYYYTDISSYLLESVLGEQCSSLF